LTLVYVVVIALMVVISFGPSLTATTILFMLIFGFLGMGNGAVFQLVPLRWPTTTAVTGSMIGEIGALGGGFIPNAMGMSKQYAGTFQWGFIAFAVLAGFVLFWMKFEQKKWEQKWIEKGGRAKVRG